MHVQPRQPEQAQLQVCTASMAFTLLGAMPRMPSLASLVIRAPATHRLDPWRATHRLDPWIMLGRAAEALPQVHDIPRNA